MKSFNLDMLKQLLKSKYNIESNNIVGVYPFGSLLYETTNEKSDLDFVVIVDMEENYIQYESEDLDIHFMSTECYKNKLKEHDIMALECYYNEEPILKYNIDFELDKIKLRKRISAIVNNSWVKAKKKLNIETEDDYIGLKSLFHSFRILSYGIDMAKENKINFLKVGDATTKILWNDIMEQYNSGMRWNEFHRIYKIQHNSMLSKFRKLAPKE